MKNFFASFFNYDVISNSLQGSDQPQLPDDGQLRLYSMRFCPFAHRVHLTLNAKNVPYHVVYINLSAKPEWYGEVNPNGKVPALQLVNEPEQPFITESLIVCEYLDEKYPGVTLYPKDPLQKAQAKLLIERFNPIAGAFYRLMYEPELKDVQKSLDEFHAGLDEFEEELKNRKTTYFGGEELNIIDYGIWPWFERFGGLAAVHGDKYKLDQQRYPKLVSLCDVQNFNGLLFYLIYVNAFI